MIIAVGSMNPVKITAVRTTVLRVWPQAFIVPVDVPSGVSVMPMHDDETIAGARNRAAAARQAADADLGVGLEGGVHPAHGALFLTGWVAVVDRNGRCGLGGGARLPLPEAIAWRVLSGEVLGGVMDDLLNDHKTNQKGGAVGALTAGLVLRAETFAVAVAYALSPFVAAELHEE